MFIDIIKNPEYSFYLDQIEQDAYVSTHRNRKNYLNLKKTLTKFLSYELIINDNNEVVAASGLKLYNNEARTASLTYITSKFRKKNLNNHLLLSEEVFVPYEIEVAKSNNVKGIFFSIELFRRRNALKKFCKNLAKQGVFFYVYPNMVNTCRKYNVSTINMEQPCWQNIAVHKTYNIIDLPEMPIKEYKKRYLKQEKLRLC